jgi:Flp pilus assembly protein TadD
MKFAPLFLALSLACLSCTLKHGREPAINTELSDQKALAFASYLRHNYQQALEEISKAEEMGPKDPEVYNIKGLIYFNLRDFKKAKESYEKALALKGDYSEARYNLCGLYLTVSDWDSAVKECSAASEDFLYKSRDRAYTSLGVAYYNMGEFEKAENAFKKSLELNPALVYTHNELGKLYLKMGRNEEAIDSFTRAIEGMENYDEAHYNLGIAYLNTGRVAEACLHFRRVVEISPNRLIGINAKNYVKTVCGEGTGIY